MYTPKKKMINVKACRPTRSMQMISLLGTSFYTAMKYFVNDASLLPRTVRCPSVW